MNIVCPPGDRRTQIILWNIPVADTIITYQQCFIQRFHSMWIKKIDCLYSYIVFLFSIKTRINKKYCFSFPIYELKHHSFRPMKNHIAHCVYFSYVVRFFLPWRQRYRESFCLQMTFIQIMKIPDYNCNKHLHN